MKIIDVLHKRIYKYVRTYVYRYVHVRVYICVRIGGLGELVRLV